MSAQSYKFGVVINWDRRAIYGVNLERWAVSVQRKIMEGEHLPRVDVAFACVTAKRADELAKSLTKWPPLRFFWELPDMAQKEALAAELNDEVRDPYRRWISGDSKLKPKLPKCAEAKEGQSE